MGPNRQEGAGMRYLSVCSGIEAASVAWHHLGWTPAAFAEIEKFPSQVLAHRFPTVPNLGDLNEFRTWDIGSIDLLVGGTPCQAFSMAGKREGLADARGNLTLTYCQLADHFDPEWIVWENVPGVFSSRDNAFGCFLGELCGTGEPLPPDGGGKWGNAGLVSGPKRTVAWRILDAQYFGVAQRRRRVFVVAVRGSRNWQCAKALFPVGEGLHWNSPPSRKTGQGTATPAKTGLGGGDWPAEVTGTLDASFGKKFGFEDQHVNAGCPLFVQHKVAESPFREYKHAKAAWVPCDCCDDFWCLIHSMHAYDCECPSLEEWETDPYGMQNEGPAALAVPFDTTQITSPQNGSNPQPGDPCHPLTSQGHPPTVAFQSSQSGVRIGSVHATLDANNGPRRHNGVIVPKASVVSPMAVRRLTPIECERLQGFPSGWTDIQPQGKPTPDGPRYKALGNSMAVPCMAWLGERIALVNSHRI